MGDMMRTHVVLPRELVTRLDDLVGPRRRSEFVAETLRKELDRRRQRVLLDAASKEAKERGNDGDPPEWATPEGTLEWVRAQRRGGTDQWASIPEES